MLSRKRFDYFPRSVLEVDSDYERFKHFDIAIYPNLLIHYPTAYYLFVSRNNESLAADIELGLNRAFADGSLDQLFFQYLATMVDKYAQPSVVIRLNNPNLPDTAPLDRKELWVDLETYTSTPSQ